MTDKKIHDLLDRFMAGETSEQEERLLTDYFCKQTAIPDEWAASAVMFRGFQQAADDKRYKPGTTGGHCEVPSSRFQHHWWMAAAAAILLLLGLWWYLPEREKQPETVAKTETPTPERTVQPATEETMQQVAIAEISKPATKIRAAKPHDTGERELAKVPVSETEATAEAVTETNDPVTDLLHIDMAAVQQQGEELRTALAIMNQELFETE